MKNITLEEISLHSHLAAQALVTDIPLSSPAYEWVTAGEKSNTD